MPGRPDRGFGEETVPLSREGSSRRQAPIGAIIRVLDAPAIPASFNLRKGTCVVGSGASCDVTVDAPTVSRNHVELGLVPEGVSVRDLGSLNGTYYQGQRVEKMVLALGARLQVGAATIGIDADTDALTEGLDFAENSYRGMVGVSRAMKRLFALLTRLEGSLATVLIEGESGVGKELVARALHEGSRVADGPFVAVNCGAIPRELVASELFGHRRGAFTGAQEARRGAFESADRGTLFLDEIGELPLDVQPVMLRAIELGEVRPVGEDQARRVKVRFIAATNRDLEAEIRAGRFRQDLFYRLAVVRLRVPPLRERPEDIEVLARRFAETLGIPEVPADVLEQLRRATWPGNVRELLNAIQAYSALGVVPDKQGGGIPSLANVFQRIVDPRRPYADQKEHVVDEFTRAYLEAIIARTGGNQSEAARIAGLNRSYLGRLLVKYGLIKPQGSAALTDSDE